MSFNSITNQKPISQRTVGTHKYSVLSLHNTLLEAIFDQRHTNLKHITLKDVLQKE